MDEEDLDGLDAYLNEDPIEVAPSFVYFLSKLSDTELGAIANLAVLILASRYDMTPHEIMTRAANPDVYTPTDEQWEDGVKSFIEIKLIEATSIHETPASND